MLESNQDIIKCEKVFKTTLMIESRNPALRVITALPNY